MRARFCLTRHKALAVRTGIQIGVSDVAPAVFTPDFKPGPELQQGVKDEHEPAQRQEDAAHVYERGNRRRIDSRDEL